MAEEENVVRELAQAILQSHPPEVELGDWASKLRVLARQTDARKRLRSDSAVGKALAKALCESKEAANMEASVSAFANLVIDDESELPGCIALFEAGTVEAFFRVALGSLHCNAKIQTLCTISMKNLALQIEEQKEDSSSCEPAILSDIASKSSLISATISLSCLSEFANVRKSALSSVKEFCSRSQILKSAFLDLDNPKMDEIMQIVSRCLKEEGRNEALKLVEMFCENRQPAAGVVGSMCLKDVETLHNYGVLQIIFDEFAFQRNCDELASARRGSALQVISYLVSAPIGPSGEPTLADDFYDRLKLLAEFDVTAKLVSFIDTFFEGKDGPFSMSTDEAEACISSSQILAFLVFSLKADRDDTKVDFFAVSKVALRGIKILIVKISALVSELRNLGRSLSREEESKRREEILPFARLRLNLLGLLNTVASSRENCGALVSLDDPINVANVCLELVQSSFDFDIEATRYALNIVRNLSLDHGNRGKVLSALPPYQVASILSTVATTSRDPNSAGLAAAVLRILLSSRDAAVLEGLFQLKEVKQLLLADFSKISPYAHVELVRTLSHLVAIVSEEGYDKDEMKASILTQQALAQVSFLLQSDQSVLHAEALSAMKNCPSSLVTLAKTVPLNMQPASSASGSSKPEPRVVDLETRLRELASLAEDTDESKAAAGQLAREILEKVM